MDKLHGDDLLVACRVVHARYAACVKTALVRDVALRLDAGAPTRKCGGLFADLTDFCGEHFRSGALVGAGAGAAAAAPVAAGASPAAR